MSGVQSLSFSVAMSGLAHWRSFFLTRLEGTMATATWALKGKETSQVGVDGFAIFLPISDPLDFWL